jgi:hypothetical protein
MAAPPKELLFVWAVFKVYSQIRSFSMRQQRRTASSTSARAIKASTKPLTSGYALIVDGQMKTEFKTKDRALKEGMELKNRFPKLQVKVFDAEEKRLEELEPVAA